MKLNKVFLITLLFISPIIFENQVQGNRGEKMELSVDEVMKGLIMAESSGNPNAVSSAGAIGLTQLMPITAKAVAEKYNVPYDEKKLTNPDYSKKLSKLHLMDLKSKYGDWHSALTAYNRGEFGMKKYKNKNKTTVSSYSKKVLKFASDFKATDMLKSKMREADTRNTINSVK
jgi:soluble lytic murein transglycosylase-like protein